MSNVNKLKELIKGLPGVTVGNTKFGSEGQEAFFIRGKEFAHFHSENELDIRLTKLEKRRLADSLKTDSRVNFRPSSDWLEVTFRRTSDLEFVVEILQAARRANSFGLEKSKTKAKGIARI